jgi:uncharacterized protein
MLETENPAVQELIDKPVSSKYPPPYHTFEVLGEYFVFDTTGCRFYKINQGAYDFLNLCITKKISEAESVFRDKAKYPIEHIEQIISSVKVLSENGLFDIPAKRFTYDYLQTFFEDYRSNKINHLELMLTDSCNLSCKYCYCSSQKRKNTNNSDIFMDENTVKRSLDSFFSLVGNAKKTRILMFGGEPLLNKKSFLYAIKYANKVAAKKKIKIDYSITTNGVMLDQNIAEILRKNHFNVMISLDGSREVHDYQRPYKNGTGSYSAVMQAISTLKANKVPIQIRATLIKKNLHLLEETINFLDSSDYEKIVISPALNANEYKTEHDFNESDLLEFVEKYKKNIPKIEKSYTKKSSNFNPYLSLINKINAGGISRDIYPVRCRMGSTAISIHPDGKVYPCSKFIGMDAWEIGSINDGLNYSKIANIWKSYRTTISYNCEKCWAYSICTGPCPHEIANSDTSFNTKINSCKAMRKLIEQSAYIANRVNELKIN